MCWRFFCDLCISLRHYCSQYTSNGSFLKLRRKPIQFYFLGTIVVKIFFISSEGFDINIKIWMQNTLASSVVHNLLFGFRIVVLQIPGIEENLHFYIEQSNPNPRFSQPHLSKEGHNRIWIGLIQYIMWICNTYNSKQLNIVRMYIVDVQVQPQLTHFSYP